MSATPPGFGVAQHAVLIGIDGIPPWVLNNAISSGSAPALAALRRRGAWSDDVRATQPSSSLSNWASILTGAPPEWHGVHTAAQSNKPTFPVRPATYPAGTIWPNMFTSAREARSNASTGAYFSWPPLGSLLGQSDGLNASVLRACSSCEKCQTAEATLVADFVHALKKQRHLLSWLYLDVLDECGHRYGALDREQYAPLVAMVDSWLGRVLRALHAAKMMRSTLVLVLSDHGRAAPDFKQHGGFTTDEMAVPWILSGVGVREGISLRWPISSTDAAPTLLHALGITPPVQMHGRAVLEAFEGFEAVINGVGWRVRAASTRNQTAHTRGARHVAASGASGGGAAARAVSASGHGMSLGAVVGGGAALLLLAVLVYPFASRALRRGGGISTGFAPGYVPRG